MIKVIVGAALGALLLTGCPNDGAPDCNTGQTGLVAKRSQSTGAWGCYRPDQKPK